MKQVLGFNMLPEMLGLWAVETCVCFMAFYRTLHGWPLAQTGGPVGGVDVAEALVLALASGLVGFALGLYRPAVCLELRRLLLKTIVSASATLVAIWLICTLCRIDIIKESRGQPVWLVAVLAWVALMLVTRLLYTLAVHRNLLVRRVAIIGAPPAAERTVEAIGSLRRWLFRIEAVHPPHGASFPQLPKQLWGVVFVGPKAATGLPKHVRTFDSTTFWEDQLARIDVDAMARRGDDPSIFARAAQASPVSTLARRALDIVAALLLLLLTAPILAAASLLVWLESPGPVIYRQERVGLNGRRFTLFKLRSMRNDAERSGPAWAAVADPRVTVVGGVIRKVRIDELPQLFNILLGDMSMVGPRPERPHFVAQLTGMIPFYQERTCVKPGLTGWAQVNYPYGATVEDARAKLSYDLYYIKHRTIAFDLMVLLATIRVVLFQEGAR